MIILTMEIIVLVDNYALPDYFDLGNLDANKILVCTIMIMMISSREDETILFLIIKMLMIK